MFVHAKNMHAPFLSNCSILTVLFLTLSMMQYLCSKKFYDYLKSLIIHDNIAINTATATAIATALLLLLLLLLSVKSILALRGKNSSNLGFA